MDRFRGKNPTQWEGVEAARLRALKRIAGRATSVPGAVIKSSNILQVNGRFLRADEGPLALQPILADIAPLIARTLTGLPPGAWVWVMLLEDEGKFRQALRPKALKTWVRTRRLRPKELAYKFRYLIAQLAKSGLWVGARYSDGKDMKGVCLIAMRP